MIIAMDMKSADIFDEFSSIYPDYMARIETSSLIGGSEIWEFIVSITPEMITALTAFFVARLKYRQKEIVLKKGEKTIKLKNVDLTPEDVRKLLKELEKKK